MGVMKLLLIKVARRLSTKSRTLVDPEQLKKQYHMPLNRKFLIQFSDDPSFVMRAHMNNGEIRLEEGPGDYDVRVVSTMGTVLEIIEGRLDIDRATAWDRVTVWPKSGIEFGAYDIDVSREVFGLVIERVRQELGIKT